MNIDQLIIEIDKNTKDFEEQFGHLTAEQLNWKPNSKSWSIGQVIDHLITSSENYFTIVEKVRKNEVKLPFLAKFKFLVRYFGKVILNSVEPQRKKKMKTFHVFEPTSSEIDPSIINKFTSQQTQLKTLIDSSRDLVASNQIISSPVNINIVYYLITAFNIIVTHQKRHFAQALEVWQFQKNQD